MNNIINIIKKIFKIISDVSFILIIAYFIVFIPVIFGFNLTTVKKNYSGIPYKEGSLIYYKRGVIEEYHKKDYILYGNKEDFYIYEVKNIDNGYIYITDDGNVKYKLKEIKGKIQPIYIPYYGRYIAFFNNNQILLYILCGIVVVDFILGSLISNFKSTYRKRDINKIEELE